MIRHLEHAREDHVSELLKGQPRDASDSPADV
jgi:hypothetical protein